MSEITLPLVLPEVDLRDFPFMPIDIGRLFGSEFHALSEDGAWRAGVTLWLKSYHQVPAASLPDDDVALARLAEFGRDLKSWAAVKEGALRGWVKCSDGRMYHPVVAEKALEGWIEKLGQRKSSAAGNAKRYGQEFDPAPFDDAIESACAKLADLNPSSRLLSRRMPKAGAKRQIGTPVGSPDDLPSGSQGKGREGKGIDQPPPPPDEPARETRDRPEGEGERLFQIVWKGFPKDPDASEPKARAAFGGLSRDDQRAFADKIGDIARHLGGKKLTNKHSLANFIAERRFSGFLATAPPRRLVRIVHRDSAEGRARDAESMRTRGVSAFWLADGTAPVYEDAGDVVQLPRPETAA